MKRYITTLLAGVLFPLLYWVSGEDLFLRSPGVAMMLFLSIYVAIAVYCYPGWD